MNPAAEIAQRAWPAVRAVLILLHIAAVIVMALPAPVGGDRSAVYRSPQVRAELQRWIEALKTVGIETNHKELSKFALDTSVSIMRGRQYLLKPFGPYYRYAGTRQSWRMFAAGNYTTSRLHIDVERNNILYPVYVARRPTDAWMSHVLDHELTRSALFKYNINPHRFRSDFRGFSMWLAQRASEDFPDATRIRVRVRQYKTPGPTEGLNPRRGQWRHNVVLQLPPKP